VIFVRTFDFVLQVYVAKLLTLCLSLTPTHTHRCTNVEIFTTQSLIRREEHRLRVFENRVLRRVFGPKRDEVTGKWRKLHNEELHDLYSSPSIIRMIKSRRMRWAGHVARMGGKGTHIDYWWKARGKETTRKTKT
jgi:hypothetical protein